MKQRSAPIYVRAGDEVISLVLEVEAKTHLLPVPGRLRARTLSPSRLFVINSAGVRGLGFPSRKLGILGMAAALVLGPLQYGLLGRRR